MNFEGEKCQNMKEFNCIREEILSEIIKDEAYILKLFNESGDSCSLDILQKIYVSSKKQRKTEKHNSFCSFLLKYNYFDSLVIDYTHMPEEHQNSIYTDKIMFLLKALKNMILFMKKDEIKDPIIINNIVITSNKLAVNVNLTTKLIKKKYSPEDLKCLERYIIEIKGLLPFIRETGFYELLLADLLDFLAEFKNAVKDKQSKNAIDTIFKYYENIYSEKNMFVLKLAQKRAMEEYVNKAFSRVHLCNKLENFKYLLKDVTSFLDTEESSKTNLLIEELVWRRFGYSQTKYIYETRVDVNKYLPRFMIVTKNVVDKKVFEDYHDLLTKNQFFNFKEKYDSFMSHKLGESMFICSKYINNQNIVSIEESFFLYEKMKELTIVFEYFLKRYNLEMFGCSDSHTIEQMLRESLHAKGKRGNYLLKNKKFNRILHYYLIGINDDKTNIKEGYGFRNGLLHSTLDLENTDFITNPEYFIDLTFLLLCVIDNMYELKYKNNPIKK